MSTLSSGRFARNPSVSIGALRAGQRRHCPTSPVLVASRRRRCRRPARRSRYASSDRSHRRRPGTAARSRHRRSLFVHEGCRSSVRPRAAAQLECSKVFAKDFMARHGIPTARYRVCDHAAAAPGHDRPRRARISRGGQGRRPRRRQGRRRRRTTGGSRRGDPRGDGASGSSGPPGRGSCSKNASPAPRSRFSRSATAAAPFRSASAQDHKRIFDGDQGPNTGGMGAFAPSPLVDAALSAQIMREIVDPVVARHEERRARIPGFSLRRTDADLRRPEGDRVQRALRRSGGAGGAALARRRARAACSCPRRAES